MRPPTGTSTTALAAAFWSATCGMLKLYWASGGTALRDTVALPGEAWSDPGFVVLGLWGAVGLAAGGAVVALALARPWGRRVPRWMLLAPTWGAAVLLSLRGAWGLAAHTAAATGALTLPASVAPGAIRWELALHSPLFLVGGLLWGAAAWRGRTARPQHPTRRWSSAPVAGLVGAALVLVAAYAAMGLAYRWAWSALERSTTARAVVWFDADVDDQQRFPARAIPAGGQASPLPAEPDAVLAAWFERGERAPFDEFLGRVGTRSLLVAHDDRLVYERYFDDAERHTLQTSFSVAKSFTSTLVGIAVDEGLIGGVDDAVTDYLPELAARDPRFERITLRHLLSMSSGLGYREAIFFSPWGDDTAAYYGVDLREVALGRTRIERPPGQNWHYNNYNPQLLGLVLERATGMAVSEYMASRLWAPLGAERDATWNLDSQRSGFELMQSGLNVTAADYARFGLLFLHGGEYDGRRIVSEEWVRAATAADEGTAPASHYAYLWWLDTQRPGRFYARGNHGQYVYVAPDADAVVVRTGRQRGVDNDAWVAIFRDVADHLAQRPEAPAPGPVADRLAR